MLYREYKDLKGNIAETRAKDTHSVEVDGNGLFSGHKFLLKTRLYGDKRCVYCGKWFHWKDTDWFKWVKEENLDKMNLDGVVEPLHCGSEHCQEFHRRVLAAQKKIQEEAKRNIEKKMFILFKQLKKRGVIK